MLPETDIFGISSVHIHAAICSTPSEGDTDGEPSAISPFKYFHFSGSMWTQEKHNDFSHANEIGSDFL